MKCQCRFCYPVCVFDVRWNVKLCKMCQRNQHRKKIEKEGT